MTKRCGTNGSKKNVKKARDDSTVPEDTEQQDLPIELPGIPFKIPELPLEQIFGSLNPADIIRFALSSVTSYNFLNNNLRVPATKIKFSNRSEQASAKFRIVITMPNQLPCEICIDTDERGKEPRHEKTQKIWGRDAWLWTRNSDISLTLDKRHDAKMLTLEMSQLVLRVFNTGNIEMRSVGLIGDNDTFTYIRGVQHFSKMTIRWHTPSVINLERLQFILQTLSTDVMYFNVCLPNLKYTGLLNQRILLTFFASWLTGEALMNMRCETLIAKGTKLRVGDINKFVKEWQTNQEKFERLELVCLKQHERFAIDPEELCLEKWPPQGEYSRNITVAHPESTWFCKRGELFATLELCANNLVKFYVWHSKFLMGQANHDLERQRVESLWNNP